MKQRYFIADIHLSENEPVITAGFLHFLHQLPDNCELYILGDLFDYWIGDDILSSLQTQIADEIGQLAARGIKSYFIHGNRDFLIGQRFAQCSNMLLLPEIQLLTDDNKKILILHGDTLCTDDLEYQKFRRKMHNKWLRGLFILLPKTIRQWIANKIRNQSCESNQQKSMYIMDVNQLTVSECMREYDATLMIHGHTHKPAIHHFKVDGRPVSRAVLAAWHDGVNYYYLDQYGQLEFSLTALNMELTND